MCTLVHDARRCEREAGVLAQRLQRGETARSTREQGPDLATEIPLAIPTRRWRRSSKTLAPNEGTLGSSSGGIKGGHSGGGMKGSGGGYSKGFSGGTGGKGYSGPKFYSGPKAGKYHYKPGGGYGPGYKPGYKPSHKPGHRPGYKHHHHKKHYYYYYGGPYFYYEPYYYGDAGECAWLYRKAVQTGSAYWWNRYNECIGY